MSLGNRIRQARLRKGYSQQYLAGQLRITQCGYRKIETDEVKLKVDTLLQLVELLEVDVMELLTGEPSSFYSARREGVNQPGPAAASGARADRWERERGLYEQLLESQELRIQLQQNLLIRTQQELEQLKAGQFSAGCAPPAQFGEPIPGSPRYVHPQDGELLYQDCYLEVYYHTRYRLMVKRWQNQLTLEAIQQGTRIVLELLKESKSTKLMADTRLLEGDWRMAKSWISREFYPQAQQIGLRQFANVYSADPLSRVSADEAMDMCVPGIKLCSFGLVGQARQWLAAG